ncbi:MAG: hypothetical protein QW240_04810 [Candidatus Caldarchaeum sp.]
MDHTKFDGDFRRSRFHLKTGCIYSEFACLPFLRLYMADVKNVL